MFKKLNFSVRHLCCLAFVLASPQFLSAAGPDKLDLLSTEPFVILAGSAVTSTGGGAIVGDVGVSPASGSFIGVTCPQVVGTIYAVDAAGPACAVIDATLLTTAKSDLMTAYNDAAGRTPIPSGSELNPGGGNMAGLTLAPGLYKFSSAASIDGGDLTLEGGPEDVWIFQIGTKLDVASGAKVVLAGGARAENIFWQVGTSAVLGTFSVFKGTILADQSITMETSSTLEGRALAFSAGVVFNGSGAAAPVVLADEPEIAVEQPLGVDILDGGSRDFGSVVVGGDNSLTFTIKNTGTADLTDLTISIDGADASLFSVTVNPIAPVSGPDGSTTFTVQFAPLTVGLKAAALRIANNDSSENPFDIALTGTATAIPVPEIVVEQPLGMNVNDGGTRDFGSVVVGSDNSLSFTIKNIGAADLTDLTITIDGADASLFSVTAAPTAPVSGPNGSTTFTVRFAPLTVGLKAAALRIASNDSSENPFDIVLTGTATDAPVPEIVVEQPLGENVADGGSKDFGSVAIGDDNSLIFTIGNIGTADLTGLGISITGTDAALFTVIVDPTAPVAPNGTTTFAVRFAPLTTGLKTAVLEIANNDGDEAPFTLALTGTGTLPVLVTVITPIALNPQTGLFEQIVRLSNVSPVEVSAARVLIQGLPVDVEVYNAAGEIGGVPFVQYNFPLAAFESVDLVIEYYRLSREAIPPPAFVPEVTAPITPIAPGSLLAVDRVLLLEDGRFLIEFSATPGVTYGIQYSGDMVEWTTVVPTVNAPANKVQWYDDGPPKTESMPESVSSRFYRIFELP